MKVNIGKKNPDGITWGIAIAIAVVFIFSVVCLFKSWFAVVPVDLIALGAWSMYRGYLAGKSNSTTQVGTGTPNVHVEDNTGNEGWTHTAQFWIGVACLFFGLISLYIQYLDR
jgi:hypothetical protein